MDVSKMCIDSTDVNEASLTLNSIPSLERDTLPSLNQLPIYEKTTENKLYNTSLQTIVHNGKSHIYRNISPAKLRTKYQQQYLLQHQYLKSYTPTREDHEQTDQKLYYYPYQIDSPFTDKNSSSSASTPLPSLPNKRPLAPQPRPSPLNMPAISENNNPLKTIIDQCSSIYEKIAKYRADPLRESERNQIIDQVYKTAENMLQSLKEMEGVHAENPDSTMVDYTSDSATAIVTGMTKAGLNDDQMNEPMNEEYKMIRQARNLQENSRPKYRRRSKRSMIGQRCHSCNTSETPEWRRGPDGARTLCNACGLHYSKLLRKGSLTVQTHNYTIEEKTRVPRAIQFPEADTPSPTSIQNEITTSSRISEAFNEDESELNK